MSQAPATHHNLPARLTSFVGREQERADLAALLDAERLVTLIGAPGVGKTRLGLQIADRQLDRFPDGVWLVELAPLGDPELVPFAVAAALGVREQPGRTIADVLTDWLRSRHLLLLLDNCEHLVEAVAALAAVLLPSCPHLHVLATSREPLGVDGEVVRRVPSLTVPDVGHLPPTGPEAVATLFHSEAVRLFVDRASAADASFALTARNAEAVARVCQRLDGIPLALELAAARVRALTVDQIAARLDDRFSLLVGGGRSALPRQQTLRGAVDWSYELLSDPERAMLRRLAVFAGGFTLGAADAVARGEGRAASEPSNHSPPTTRYSLLDLVDRSLVQVEEREDGERRYRLLETIRQYGHEKLIEHGELAEARRWHRDYFVAFTEKLGPHLFAAGQTEAIALLHREHDNLRVALATCLEEAVIDRGAPRATETFDPSLGVDAGVRIARVLWHLWWRHGYIDEGRRWLDQIRTLPSSDQTPGMLSARAEIHWGAADLAANQDDWRLSADLMEDALALWRSAGDRAGIVRGLHRLGLYRVALGDFEQAEALSQESIDLARSSEDPSLLAHALIAGAIVAGKLGQFGRSAALAEESFALCRQSDNAVGAAYALLLLARAEARTGDPARATALADEALGRFRDLRDHRGVALSHSDLGHIALLTGDIDRAIGMLQASIRTLREIGNHAGVDDCLRDLVRALTLQATQIIDDPRVGRTRSAAARERLLDAVRLSAAAAGLREAKGIVLHPSFQADDSHNLAIARECLGEEAFALASAEGRALSLELAAALALAIPMSATLVGAPEDARRGGPPAPHHEGAGLTRREQEIAIRVAHGQTNRQIAEALGLSDRTIDAHLRNIMGKLGVTSRAQVAAWSVAHGLVEGNPA